MAYVSDIIFCLNATNNPGQGVCANTILSAITPDYIPGLFTFSVVIIVNDINLQTEHDISIDFVNEKETVGHIDGRFPPLPDDNNLPNEYKGINLTMDWNNTHFKESGIYKLIVRIDGEVVGEKSIYVKGKNQQ